MKNTQDQEHRMNDDTTPQDSAAMPPASTGSGAERPLGDPEIAVEILRLRVAELEEAIRRLAEQDALLSVLCKRDGSQVVTVTMDGTLTDAEQSLIRRLAAACEGGHPREWTNRALTADDRATLRGLLERLG